MPDLPQPSPHQQQIFDEMAPLGFTSMTEQLPEIGATVEAVRCVQARGFGAVILSTEYLIVRAQRTGERTFSDLTNKQESVCLSAFLGWRSKPQEDRRAPVADAIDYLEEHMQSDEAEAVTILMNEHEDLLTEVSLLKESAEATCHAFIELIDRYNALLPDHSNQKQGYEAPAGLLNILKELPPEKLAQHTVAQTTNELAHAISTLRRMAYHPAANKESKMLIKRATATLQRQIDRINEQGLPSSDA